jgi:hypothetical protein
MLLVDLLLNLAGVLRRELDTLAEHERGTREQRANSISNISSNENRDWECLPRSVPSYSALALTSEV